MADLVTAETQENTDATVETGQAEEQQQADAVDNESSEGETSEGTGADEGTGESADDAEQTAPGTYSDFAMPEGIELDAKLLESATPLFKELGLTQEQAQKVVDFEAARVAEQARSQAEAFEQLKADWRDQSMNDPEFGGEAFEENVSTAREALKKFGDAELSQLMEDYGIGNHPAVIRALVKIGKLTREDNPSGDRGAPASKKDRVSVMYSKE